MKIVKVTITIILGLLLVTLALGFTLEPKWETSSRLQIPASKDNIFPYINTLRKWPDWTAWNKNNYPNIVNTFDGAPSGIGAVQQWDDGSSDGMITITDSKPGQSIMYTLSMEQGQISMQGRIHLQARGDNTLVVWQLSGDAGNNPIGKIIMYIYKPIIAKELTAGLENLKLILEK